MSDSKENIVLAMPARIDGKLVPVTGEPVSVSATIAEQLREAGAVKQQEHQQKQKGQGVFS